MAEDKKSDDRMLVAFNALIEGQKRSLRFMETSIGRYSVIETEIVKINRKLSALHELAIRNHGEDISRLDAIAARLEEAEKLGDERASEITKLHIEMSSQYNDILSALQLATNSINDTSDFSERLEQLEKRLGL